MDVDGASYPGYIGEPESTSEDTEMQTRNLLVMFALDACNIDEGTYEVDAEGQEVDNNADVRGSQASPPDDEDSPADEFTQI